MSDIINQITLHGNVKIPDHSLLDLTLKQLSNGNGCQSEKQPDTLTLHRVKCAESNLPSDFWSDDETMNKLQKILDTDTESIHSFSLPR